MEYDTDVTIVGSFSYDGYGVLLQDNAVASSNPGKVGAQQTSLLYAGEQFDTNLQQYYLRARWYDPAVSRFNRIDPFVGNNQDPQSLHKYLYCHCNPINGTDPSGEAFFVLAIPSLTNILVGVLIGAFIFLTPLLIHGLTSWGYLTIVTKNKSGGSSEYTVRVRTGWDFANEILKVDSSGKKITFFEFVGHGTGNETDAKGMRGMGLTLGKGGIFTKMKVPGVRARDILPEAIFIESLQTFMVQTFDPQSLHKYAYVRGNPINNVDPSRSFAFYIKSIKVIIGRQKRRREQYLPWSY